MAAVRKAKPIIVANAAAGKFGTPSKLKATMMVADTMAAVT
jgi:hypothetical protein